MNIVMLLSNPFRPDPRVIKEAESLVAAGYQIKVICWDRAAEYPEIETLVSGVKIHRIQQVASGYGIGARQAIKILRFWKATLSILRHLQPDLLHCHDFDTLPAGLWWGKLRRIPVVYDAHEYYAELTRTRLHGFWGKLLYQSIRVAEQFSARLADAVITVDETLGNIYARYNQRVLIIGHYPKRELATPPPEIFQGEELRLLYMGRISTERGMMEYLEILRGLRARGIPARLILAGVFLPAEEQTHFQQASHDISPWINFTGWVPYQDLSKTLRDADVGLAILHPFPRFVAAVPVKLFEYMAAGLPVIVSDFPAIRSIVATHQCGRLINPVSGTMNAIETIQEWWENRELAKSIGDRGRLAVLEHYNWEHLMQGLFRLYKVLTTKR